MVAINKVAKQYPWMNEDILYSSDYRIYQMVVAKKGAKQYPRLEEYTKITTIPSFPSRKKHAARKQVSFLKASSSKIITLLIYFIILWLNVMKY